MTDITRLDPRLLLAFVAISEERSVTGAAKRMNMTQQGMSGTLARLREVFEERLFVRIPHGVSPTPYAEELYPKVLVAIDGLKSLMEAETFNPRELETTVYIATSDYALSVLAQPLFENFKKLSPNLRLVIVPLQIEKLTDQMRTGVVDLALTIPEFLPENLYSMTLFSDRYVCAFRKGHPLATKKLTIDAFCKVEQLLVAPNGLSVHSETDRILAETGHTRTVGIAVPSFLVAQHLLASTDLLGMLPARLLRGTAESLFVTEPPIDVPSFDIICAWSARVHTDPVNMWIREVLRTLIGE